MSKTAHKNRPQQPPHTPPQATPAPPVAEAPKPASIPVPENFHVDPTDEQASLDISAISDSLAVVDGAYVAGAIEPPVTTPFPGVKSAAAPIEPSPWVITTFDASKVPDQYKGNMGLVVMDKVRAACDAQYAEKGTAPFIPGLLISRKMVQA